ncbi:hypothetical protein MOD25_07425 [Bacillus haynesii]|uniref:hypothetical protein n=1 Tax=Bacillus haynesii TaxID=1925021 RepID=UPI002282247B|nr:hypothetical protein [Bacillus haynesii]MCY8549736.1 hypothetical protein [Bacillus haynesii]
MHFTLETTYHENGIVEAIVMENKHTTHIQYNPATGMTILNGVTLETKKEFEMGLPAYKEVYMGTVTNNVPAGTLVGAAISLTSIWTRVPASRVKQTVLTLTSLAVGETLDKLIKVKIKQYRTSKPVKDGSMCYKQYKYKHKSTKGNNSFKIAFWFNFYFANTLFYVFLERMGFNSKMVLSFYLDCVLFIYFATCTLSF